MNEKPLEWWETAQTEMMEAFVSRCAADGEQGLEDLQAELSACKTEPGRWRALRAHIRGLVANKPHICPSCGRSYVSMGDWRNVGGKGVHYVCASCAAPIPQKTPCTVCHGVGREDLSTGFERSRPWSCDHCGGCGEEPPP